MAYNRSPLINATALGTDFNDTDNESSSFPDALLKKADLEAEAVLMMFSVFLCGCVMAFSYIVWQCINGLPDAVLECLLYCSDWWKWCTNKKDTTDQEDNDDDMGHELTHAKDEDLVCE